MNPEEIKRAISKVRANPHDDALLADAAVELAASLLRASREVETRAEKRQGATLARMMEDEPGMAFTLAMADQVFRPPSAARSANQFRHLVDSYGVPDFLPLPQRAAIAAGSIASAILPQLVMPAVTASMRSQSSGVILPAEPPKLRPLLRKRRQGGMRMNLNLLGEAILGEGEAEKRIVAILDRIADPDCTYFSVKISAIFSQIHLVAYDHTVDEIKTRMRRLYRAAIANPVDGKPKFINLDMEEYRDLRLTCDVFQQLLDEPEFKMLEAGIVLQAYLPDSWSFQKKLTAWALDRVAKGGAGIKIRIAKGANLAMESVDAELHGWEMAPYASKLEVDANFKRMLHEGCTPAATGAVRLGVASHNLFDISYALLLREREGVADRVEFEMLEGMANHQARTVGTAASGLLLYAPIVRREDFHSAIAYLVRRLDENTTKGNFLHDIFSIREGNAAWENQKSLFLEACKTKDGVSDGPRRKQDRSTETHTPSAPDAPFQNAADTDWSLPANAAWARKKVEALLASEIPPVPLVINGREEAGENRQSSSDPSRPGKIPYFHEMAGSGQIDRALACAVDARANWVALGFEARAGLLRNAAAEISAIRGEAIATMVMDAGKSVTEADVELSEAIDFANYYSRSIETDGASPEPLGTVLVTPPWNFPFAIPCGGVLAALVAGNTVILKPAPETVLTAWLMANALWKAGVPRNVLQFLPCPDNELGRALVTDPRISAVVLTGAYETADMFLGWKPEMRLFAETSGKNALIITAAADPDQAIKDLVKSAFGHSGQKCSAASLAIIEAELYDSPGFRTQLRDAAASLVCGPAWNFAATATPIVRPPGEALERALTRLEPGEEWLLKPEMKDQNPCLWSPGIRLGVSPDGWFRRTECFGPVLGLIRADNLSEAIRIQNDSGFALTGGIHSLDDREVEIWKERVEAGNAYINRPITGAIVQRQPFGGWKRSSIGPGAKAGGPNYVAQFMSWKNTSPPQQVAAPSLAMLERLVSAMPGEAAILRAAAGSDAFWKQHEFGAEHDPSGLRCEANVFRYRTFPKTLIRIDAQVCNLDAARLLLAAEAIGAPYSVSSETGLAGIGINSVVESEEAFLATIDNLAGQSGTGCLLRAPGASPAIRKAAHKAGMRLACGPVLWNAKLEWPAWHREQVVSETLHRYGNIVSRPT